jgi:hypothetical protein
MLEAGDQHFVAGLEEGAAPALGDQVDALGGALGEDEFALVLGIKEGL